MATSRTCIYTTFGWTTLVIVAMLQRIFCVSQEVCRKECLAGSRKELVNCNLLSGYMSHLHCSFFANTHLFCFIARVVCCVKTVGLATNLWTIFPKGSVFVCITHRHRQLALCPSSFTSQDQGLRLNLGPAPGIFWQSCFCLLYGLFEARCFGEMEPGHGWLVVWLDCATF